MQMNNLLGVGYYSIRSDAYLKLKVRYDEIQREITRLNNMAAKMK